MVRANLVLQVGGLDEDVEADEVSCRNAITGDDDKPKIQWTRFVGVVRRGSSLYYWGELDSRVTSAKQGGGGKLGTEEWHHHMMKRGHFLASRLEHSLPVAPFCTPTPLARICSCTG